MGCRSVAEKTRIITRIRDKQIQLDTANVTYGEALEDGTERYKFDSHEGSQQTWNRSLTDLKNQIDSLEAEIDQLYRRLVCGGIVNLNLRRKRGPYGRSC